MQERRGQLFSHMVKSYFQTPRHHYGTRYANQKKFEIIRVNNAKEKSLLKCIGPTKWSHIPILMKKAPFLKTFMSQFRAHLIEIHNWLDFFFEKFSLLSFGNTGLLYYFFIIMSPGSIFIHSSHFFNMVFLPYWMNVWVWMCLFVGGRTLPTPSDSDIE